MARRPRSTKQQNPGQELRRQNQYLKLLGAVTLKIRQSLQLEEILQTTVTEVRHLLDCDRVLVYCFDPNGTASAITESVTPGYPAVLGQTLPPEVFPLQVYQDYCQGQVRAIADIKQTKISPCLVEFLHQFQVKAKLVVPILLQETLWGLLVAHQCQATRTWAEFEIELLEQVANHLGIAIAQSQLLEALRLSEERYALAMQAANDGLWDWNLITNEVYFSPRWKAILGYGVEDLHQGLREWLDRIHPQAAEQVKTQITDHLQGKLPHFKSEHPVQHRDGTYRWLLVQGLAERDAHGQVVRMVGSCSDITQRKQTEQQLRLLESVVINANDAVLITEAEPVSHPGPRILYVNQAFTRMTGYTLPEIVGKTPRLLQGPKTNRATLSKIRAALRKWQPIQAELINYCKDGTEFWVEVNIAPVADETGWYTHWISIQRDITTRKQAEEAIQQQAERERLLAQIAQRIRQSLQLSEILATTVAEVQEFLNCDRVLIYRLWPEGTGSAVTETVSPGWPAILGQTFPAEVFPPEYQQLYQQGRIRAIANVDTESVTPCLVEFLHLFQVKAKLVVSIMQGDRLWGLLIAHHCSHPRSWQPLEIDLLSALATQLTIAIQQAELYHQLQGVNQELQHLVSLDSLTAIANRRRFDDYLETAWRQMAQEQKPISLILCDIDCFKLYNDTYGHPAGDHCIQQVAKAISRAIHYPADLVARYGGEEFAVILVDTSLEGALKVAQKIRAEVQALHIVHSSSQVQPYITLSLGVATTIPTPQASIPILVALADEALYQAKHQGRDRVVSASSIPNPISHSVPNSSANSISLEKHKSQTEL